jgi:hypothetical protein
MSDAVYRLRCHDRYDYLEPGDILLGAPAVDTLRTRFVEIRSVEHQPLGIVLVTSREGEVMRFEVSDRGRWLRPDEEPSWLTEWKAGPKLSEPAPETKQEYDVPAGATGAEGWAMPGNARKWHYYVDGRSLCGKWVILGGSLQADTGRTSSADCAGCRAKVEKRRAAAT